MRAKAHGMRLGMHGEGSGQGWICHSRERQQRQRASLRKRPLLKVGRKRYKAKATVESREEEARQGR